MQTGTMNEWGYIESVVGPASIADFQWVLRSALDQFKAQIPNAKLVECSARVANPLYLLPEEPEGTQKIGVLIKYEVGGERDNLLPRMDEVIVKGIQNPGRIPWHEEGCPMQQCASEEHDFMGGGYDYRCKNCEDGLCECNCDSD